MKKINIQIEIDGQLEEPSIVIKASAMDKQVQKIVDTLDELSGNQTDRIIIRDEGRDIVLKLSEILFFEAVDSAAYAHTKDRIFRIRQSLVDLEATLPTSFARISRSGIANLAKISEIKHNLQSSSLVKFTDSSKQTTISRRFYKPVKNQLFTYMFNNQKEEK